LNFDGVSIVASNTNDDATRNKSPRVWFDVFDGAASIESGTIALPNAPGFGIALRTGFRG